MDNLRKFLSTPSARRATGVDLADCPGHADFYPRPPRGGRLRAFTTLGCSERFLSTPSARRATAPDYLVLQDSQFLSTPSARRATWRWWPDLQGRSDFYPRPPRGGRPQFRLCFGGIHHISIHALREEGDGMFASCCCSSKYFYPRPPRGGRPNRFQHSQKQDISIHALREEGDASSSSSSMTMTNFYPRPPRGGRRLAQRSDLLQASISIHALREEGDWTGPNPAGTIFYFYPRPPRGGRP